jgi:N-acetylmuramoyl-L-alanine amidase
LGVALVLIFAFGGCATVAKVPEAFPYTTVRLQDGFYYALMPMCVREGYAWDYDPFSQVLILEKNDQEAKLLVGSKTVLVGKDPFELSAPVILREGVVYAPVDFQKILQPSVCRLPAPSPEAGAFLRPVQTVILDAGHGGKDPGAIGRLGLKEKTVVIDVVSRVKRELEHCGLSVSTTRDDDTFIPLPERSALANRGGSDIFVSIHANANRSRRIEGFEVYHLTEKIDDNARALDAAESGPPSVAGEEAGAASFVSQAILWDLVYTENRRESIALARCIGNAVSRRIGLKVLGIKGAGYAVLKGTQMPAVLVEVGYISNREGERRLGDPNYRQRLAEAIAQGIMDFKNMAEKGN